MAIILRCQSHGILRLVKIATQFIPGSSEDLNTGSQSGRICLPGPDKLTVLVTWPHIFNFRSFVDRDNVIVLAKAQ